MPKGLPEPARYGKYVLLERIGRGGMSEVFLAKTEGIEGFERKVALKRIFPSYTENRDFVEAFIHEARIGGALYHHNVVQTLDFGRGDDSTYYIALEYIEGTHLGAIIRECQRHGRMMPPGVFLQIAIQICEGLDYIHHRAEGDQPMNLVHRDVKPSNMLINAQGVVKISDFGVAKAESSGGRTAVGSLKGTVGYMSPEQTRSEKVTSLSDLYSLGTLFFEAATLKRLYGDGDVVTILQRVRDSDFQLPLSKANALIAGLEGILNRMLAPRTEDRYPDAGQVAQALRALPCPVADRTALVAFLRELHLLDATLKDASDSPSSPALEDQRTECVLPQADQTQDLEASGTSPPRAKASFSWQTLLFVFGVLCIGIAAAILSFFLVEHLLTEADRARVISSLSGRM